MAVERFVAANSNPTAKGGKGLAAEVSVRVCQSSDGDDIKQTRLPSIESATKGKRGGKTIVFKESDFIKQSRTSAPDVIYHTQRQQSKVYRKRLSGGEHRGKRLPVDINAVKSDEKSRERMSGRRSHSAGKFHLEPLHRPEVDLKSTLPKLCGRSPSTHKDSSIATQPDADGELSWEPFSCTCRHCGLKFGKHSIVIHERRCLIKQTNACRSSFTDTEGTTINTVKTTSSLEASRPVARIVTVGLGSIYCEQLTLHACLPARPETRTLRHSSLRDSGFGLPFISAGASKNAEYCINAADSSSTEFHSKSSNINDPSGQGMILCEHCGRVVAADRINVHSRLCKPDVLQKISMTSVRFPHTFDRLKVEQENSSRQPHRTPGKKPPTVICYICGREYGTKSIAIHEPQCLKKFEVENRKLPISKRKPLPKKPLEEKAKIVQVISKEDQIVAAAISGGHSAEPMDERMDRIFQQCYTDFERELVPCKRCGRRFAPDRHELHEPKCNAKPLRTHKHGNHT